MPTADAAVINDLSLIKKWSNETQSGDIGELTYIAEDSKALPLVDQYSRQLPWQRLPIFDEDCYLLRARKKAMQADLVVVNHHLFFADMALKDTGFGELLPNMDVVIFDEAHQIPDIASEYFGETLSSRTLLELCKELELICKTELRDHPQLSKTADKAGNFSAGLALALVG